MASNDGVLLTEASARMLKREIAEWRRVFKNAMRSLQPHLDRRQGSYQPEPKVRFKNESSETVPAHGVMRITGSEKKKHLKIDKPDTSKQPLYLVNGPKAIGAGKYGFGRYLTSQPISFQHHYVLYDSADGTPAYGETWGPESASWKLNKGKPGFTILGGNDTDAKLTAAVQQRAAQKGRLVARLTADLDRWTYASDGSPTDLIGRINDYGDPGNEEVAPHLPSAACEIWEAIENEDDPENPFFHYQIAETGATAVNPTPWKFYEQTADNGVVHFGDQDLLYVVPHGGFYLVERPVNWTPSATFRATTVDGSNQLQWAVTAATEALTSNKVRGEIAEVDSTDTSVIRILAPGRRYYEARVELHVAKSGASSPGQQTVSMSGAALSEAVANHYFTAERDYFCVSRTYYLKRGDAIQVTHSADQAVTRNAFIYIKPESI